MIRPPPRSTRTDTPFPYTTLFRALDDPLRAAYSSALTDPASKVIELTSADGATRLRGALADDGVGYLRADELPELPDDRTYQLWGAAGDELVSLGVLGADPGIDRKSTRLNSSH